MNLDIQGSLGVRLVIGTILVWPSPAFVHHSPAAYDLSVQSILELEGVIVGIHWANPHVFVDLATESPDGEAVTWLIELDAPSNLERHGWFRDSLAKDEHVAAEVFPPRDSDRLIAKLFAIVKTDGTRLSYIDPAQLDRDAPAATRATGLGGIWAPDPLPPYSATARLQEQLLRASFGFDADVPLTEQGYAALRGFADEQSPTADCIPRTAPSITMYSSGLQSIEIREDVVVLRENWFGTERTVDLRATSHDGAPPAIQGHSIGRFDGSDLVVDSARFTEHREGLFNKLPSSAGKHLIERFRLHPDGHSLVYSWVLTDPQYLTEPISGENRWTYRPDLAFTTVACSLDSARRFLDD